jgi:hypothetical protein
MTPNCDCESHGSTLNVANDYQDAYQDNNIKYNNIDKNIQGF